MLRLLVSTIFVLFTASCATSNVNDKLSANEEAPKVQPETEKQKKKTADIRCKKHVSVGSRMKTRSCTTKSQRAEERRQAQEGMRRKAVGNTGPRN